MKTSCIGLLLGALLALPLAAAEPASNAKAEETTQTPEEFREGLQAAETEIISKAVSMTADEATKFWPLFKEFQSEQQVIIDAQLDALRQYADDYASLTDAQAVAYVNALLERDERIHDLRVKYLAEYSKVLPAGKAARVIHLSRRLGIASQAKLASEIPLVH
jgi:hypothetical protein